MGRTLEAGVVNFGRGLAGVPVASGERRSFEKEIGFARPGCHATGQKVQVAPNQVIGMDCPHSVVGCQCLSG